MEVIDVKKHPKKSWFVQRWPRKPITMLNTQIDLAKMAANCLKCGGAMHLDCAGENGDRCITPGCEKK